MTSGKRRVGIYPGTFDPVHAGHLAFALGAKRACGLDEVIFLPEAKPRGKSNVTSLGHRIALIKRATADIAGFRVLELSSRQFSVVDTLPEIWQLCGQHDLTLLVGSDIVHTFSHRWPGIDSLLRDVSLAIGMRAGDKSDHIAAILNQLETAYHLSITRTLIYTSEADKASSRIRTGTSALSALHPDVQAYIQKYRLYTRP